MKKLDEKDLMNVNGGNNSGAVYSGAVCNNSCFSIEVSEVYNKNSQPCAGGVIYNPNATSNNFTIENCFNSGKVEDSTGCCGGFIGKIQ